MPPCVGQCVSPSTEGLFLQGFPVVVFPLHFKFLDLLLLELLSEEEEEEESDLLLMFLEKIVFCSCHMLHDMKKRISRSIFGRKENFFLGFKKTRNARLSMGHAVSSMLCDEREVRMFNHMQ
jgi:transcriptional antiterminator